MTESGELSKHGGPNDWQEARLGLKRRKAKINQRNQQIRDLKGRLVSKESEISRLRGLLKEARIVFEDIRKFALNPDCARATIARASDQTISKIDEALK